MIQRWKVGWDGTRCQRAGVSLEVDANRLRVKVGLSLWPVESWSLIASYTIRQQHADGPLRMGEAHNAFAMVGPLIIMAHRTFDYVEGA